MPNWFTRFVAGRANAPAEKKMAGAQTLFALSHLGGGASPKKGFAALTNEGFAGNPVAYRCVRLVADAAVRVPFEVREGSKVLSEHPMLDLLARPNRREMGSELLEAVYTYLQTAGNAFPSQTQGANEMSVLDGYKTYAVGALMLIVGVALTAGLELPNFADYSGPQLVMEALAVIFLRRGIKSEVGKV